METAGGTKGCAVAGVQAEEDCDGEISTRDRDAERENTPSDLLALHPLLRRPRDLRPRQSVRVEAGDVVTVVSCGWWSLENGVGINYGRTCEAAGRGAWCRRRRCGDAVSFARRRLKAARAETEAAGSKMPLHRSSRRCRRLSGRVRGRRGMASGSRGTPWGSRGRPCELTSWGRVG